MLLSNLLKENNALLKSNINIVDVVDKLQIGCKYVLFHALPKAFDSYSEAEYENNHPYILF